MAKENEVFISIDVETAGPIPAKYSMLMLGACVVDQPHITFKRQFKPESSEYVPEALKVSGLSMAELLVSGQDPKTAMEEFATWVAEQVGDATPVFVGLNAAFDWSFVNYYFHRYLGHNPFGFAPLDIKSMFFGVFASSWRDTRSSHMVRVLNPEKLGNHDALADAIAQAQLFEMLHFASLNNPSKF